MHLCPNKRYCVVEVLLNFHNFALSALLFLNFIFVPLINISLLSTISDDLTISSWSALTFVNPITATHAKGKISRRILTDMLAYQSPSPYRKGAKFGSRSERCMSIILSLLIFVTLYAGSVHFADNLKDLNMKLEVNLIRLSSVTCSL